MGLKPPECALCSLSGRVHFLLLNKSTKVLSLNCKNWCFIINTRFSFALLSVLVVLVRPCRSRLVGVWPRRHLFVLMIPCCFFSCQALFLKCFDLKGVSVRSEWVRRRSSYCSCVESTLLFCFASCSPGKMVVSLPSTSLVQKGWWEFNTGSLLHLVLQDDRGLHKCLSLCLVETSVPEMNLQVFCMWVDVWGVSTMFH